MHFLLKYFAISSNSKQVKLIICLCIMQTDKSSEIQFIPWLGAEQQNFWEEHTLFSL